MNAPRKRKGSGAWIPRASRIVDRIAIAVTFTALGVALAYVLQGVSK